MTDHYTDELFVSTDNLNESALVFPVSRVLVDPERFRDDSREVMSKKGMGAIYRHSHDGSPYKSFQDQLQLPPKHLFAGRKLGSHYFLRREYILSAFCSLLRVEKIIASDLIFL